MLERPETAVPTPFVSSMMRVEPGWIDYNGHLNMAYYNVLFDRAVDEVYELLGLGLAYVDVSRHSTFTAEVHVRYLRELHSGDPVRVTFQLLGYDAKRLHYFEELHHAEENWLSATSENMALHVDMDARKAAAFPPEIAARLTGDLKAILDLHEFATRLAPLGVTVSHASPAQFRALIENDTARWADIVKSVGISVP